jgi:hypothetical protein
VPPLSADVAVTVDITSVVVIVGGVLAVAVSFFLQPVATNNAEINKIKIAGSKRFLM